MADDGYTPNDRVPIKASGFDMSKDFELYLKASEKLAEDKQKFALYNISDSGDEFQFIDPPIASKRKYHEEAGTSSTIQRPKICHPTKPVMTTDPCSFVLADSEKSLVVEELKSKVFSHDFGSLDASTTTTTTLANEVYADLLKAMSAFHFIERKLSSIENERNVTTDLNLKLEEEKKRATIADSTILSKNVEIEALQTKLRDNKSTIFRLETDVANSAKAEDLLRQEIGVRKNQIETLKTKYIFFLGGATDIAKWEVIREYLLDGSKSFDLADMDMKYVSVMMSRAEFQGMPPPIFGESLVDIDSRMRKCTTTKPN